MKIYSTTLEEVQEAQNELVEKFYFGEAIKETATEIQELLNNGQVWHNENVTWYQKIDADRDMRKRNQA